MPKRLQFIVLFLLAFAVTPALSATVKPIHGEVLVNRGNGFEPIAAASAIEPGDTVMAGPDSVAEIIYADSCAVTVRPGAIVSVSSQPQCRQAVADFSGRMGATNDNSSPSYCKMYPDHCLLGGAAIVGAGVGIYFALRDDDKPASP